MTGFGDISAVVFREKFALAQEMLEVRTAGLLTQRAGFFLAGEVLRLSVTWGFAKARSCCAHDLGVVRSRQVGMEVLEKFPV